MSEGSFVILDNPWSTRQTVSWPGENLEFPDWTPLTIDIGLVRTNIQGTISLHADIWDAERKLCPGSYYQMTSKIE